VKDMDSGPESISVFGLVFRGLLALLGACALGPLLILPLGWKEQAILGAALIVLGILLNAMTRSNAITMMLMALSVFSTLRYGWWRVVQTEHGITSAGRSHNWDALIVLSLLAAEFFAFMTLLLGYFQTLRPLHRPPLPLSGEPADWPMVDVLIPTYNEPLHVVSATVIAALDLDYPSAKMRVLLLDDGRREEFRAFAARVGVEYMTRSNNLHAKAGNINQALKQLSGEFVAIFDCDHVPARSFLRMTLGWFLADRELGLVQTPHEFYSPDPFERNLGQFHRVPNEGELFHRLVQDGNDLWNASFFCGSCAVLRRSALDEIDGIAVETVTEDAHTALRMQRLGWNTAYINIPLAAGLATESLAAHIGQRIRWARGMTQILRIENPLFAGGLKLSQRLCYFNATTHYLFALPRLIFLTIPLVYLLFGVVNIYGYTWAILAYAFPHLVLSNLTNSRIQGRYRHSFWNEIYEAVLAPYILFPTLLALINPRLGKFNVTSKGGIMRRSYFDLRLALPYLFLLALNVAGLVMAEHRYLVDPAHRDTTIMNAVWTLYSTMILSVAASVAWERRQLRSGAPLRSRIATALKIDDGGPVDGAIVRVWRRGATVKVSEPLELARGASVVLSLGDDGDYCNIPALVAHSAGRRQHLSFPDMTSEQERCIFLLASAQPKALQALEDSRPGDRPLRSLIQIFFLAIRAFPLLALGFFSPPSAEAEEDTPSRARSRRKSAAAALLVLFIGSSLLAREVKASTGGSDNPAATESQANVSHPANFHDAFALGSLGAAKTLSLGGTGASLNFFFDEPVTKVTTSAVLHLRYAGPGLRAGQGQLEVILNGVTTGTIDLLPGASQQAEFPLPPDLLTSNNTLSFQLQGTCASCGRNSSLHVTLDPASSIDLIGTRLALGNDLSLLPLPFFDPAGLRSWSLPVVFGKTPDDTTLEGAALVASWFGVLSDVRGVNFPVSVGELPAGNAVVFALRGSSQIADVQLPSGQGPLISMRDNPRDPYGKLLIVSGDRPDDLLMAAHALTNGRGLPHAESMAASPVSFSSAPAYSAPRWLQTDELSSLGAYTTASRLKLPGTGSINVYFRVPPDLFLRGRESVPLNLAFKYAGAPLGSKARLHVRLNGQDIDTIRLNPALTRVEESEKVWLPTGSMLPYTNTLTFDFYFVGNPPVGARPSFAIGRESSLDLRGIPHSVVLPRLELFGDAGYPYTEWPDLSRTAVLTPSSPTPTDDEALLDMAGFFGAQTGSLATALTVAGTDNLDSVKDKDLVIIGAPGSQPLLSEWAGSMPLDLSGGEMRVNQSPESTLLLHPQWPFRAWDTNRLSRFVGDGSENDAIVESFASPLRADRLAVALVPSGPNATDAIRALFTPSQREGPVYGGVAVSQNGRFESFLVGTLAYDAGDTTRYQHATVLLFEYYELIPLFVVVLAALIVGWVRPYTERVAARRLATRQI
jgi:cellulose synthase (UDP-forming)